MAEPIRETIKVCHPRLPQAEALLPYLRQIDGAGQYSNFGPLLRQFEERIANQFGLAKEGVAGVANGTLGLSLALRAIGAEPRTACLMPAWTFVASAHAAAAAGLTPYFVDVDTDNWSLTPEIARRALEEVPEKVGAVLPVAPFGAPIDYEAWEAFRTETGVKVVIDAAAGFDTAKPGNIPVVLSLHATKILGVGEGGLVLSRDGDLISRVRQLSNFGFDARHEASVRAVNGKLSEYAAAVGLAALDSWQMAKVGYGWLARCYAGALSAIPGVFPMPQFGAGWVSATCPVQFDVPITDLVVQRLAGLDIETRRWWGLGCHRQPAFARCPRRPLPVTEHLAAHSVALPFHLALGPADLNRITDALQEMLSVGQEVKAPVSDEVQPIRQAVA